MTRSSPPYALTFPLASLFVISRKLAKSRKSHQPITRGLIFFWSLSYSWCQALDAPAQIGVATAHPLATQVAQYILQEKGGNAFDAAVAVSAMLAVVASYADIIAAITGIVTVILMIIWNTRGRN